MIELFDNQNFRRVHNSREAALILGISYSKLTKDRIFGRGPKFIRLGKRVVYRPEDLELYLSQNLHQSTSEYQNDP